VAGTANSSRSCGRNPRPVCHAEGPSIPHPLSLQHQPVAAAGFGVDLEVQLDQACAASGGRGGHDPPGPGGQDLQAGAAQRPSPVPQAVAAAARGVQVGAEAGDQLPEPPLLLGSSPVVGSSSNGSSGSATIAWAIPTRRRIPRQGADLPPGYILQLDRRQGRPDSPVTVGRGRPAPQGWPGSRRTRTP
jgi:hypothetical protein